MLKKLVILGIVSFVAVSVVKGSKLGSYIRSEIESLKARAQANVPPEKEIARLRSEIKQFDKADRRRIGGRKSHFQLKARLVKFGE
jgi:hypothetical protein